MTGPCICPKFSRSCLWQGSRSSTELEFQICQMCEAVCQSGAPHCYICQSSAPHCDVQTLVQLPSGSGLWFSEMKAYKALITKWILQWRSKSWIRPWAIETASVENWAIHFQILNGPFCLANFLLFCSSCPCHQAYKGSPRLAWQADWPGQPRTAVVVLTARAESICWVPILC